MTAFSQIKDQEMFEPETSSGKWIATPGTCGRRSGRRSYILGETEPKEQPYSVKQTEAF